MFATTSTSTFSQFVLQEKERLTGNLRCKRSWPGHTPWFLHTGSYTSGFRQDYFQTPNLHQTRADIAALPLLGELLLLLKGGSSSSFGGAFAIAQGGHLLVEPLLLLKGGMEGCTLQLSHKRTSCREQRERAYHHQMASRLQIWINSWRLNRWGKC